ncbi:MAG TPA: 5-carboxymethyl-2-hydroxymuconate semialdehyde dehydrogenase [Chloroflexota bacterium]|nr:5-carboxymethyl-2-hydroxymuconate semialdehyde dehydrogenase [Chloroflexota bacterium]
MTTTVSAIAPVEHFIDGEYRPADGERFETLNPATNEPITTVAAGTAAAVDAAVRAARRAFDEGPWPRMTARERATYLRRIGDLISRYNDEIAALETLDTGVPIQQTSRALVPRAAENFYFFAEMAQRLQGELFPVEGQFLNYTTHYPAGVAGLITPWNTPFMLETWKIAPCLSAGDTCVLKPAEWSPLSANFLGRIMAEAELPPGVFNIVHGFGETAGAALVAHPGVQLISFTGETITGQEIMRNAAATLKRLSMELGGKSPVIVFADADLDRALDAAIFGVYSLNGERCTAGSRLLVQRPVYDELTARLAERVRRIRLGDPFDPQTEVGPLIHPDHAARVLRYLEIGLQEGARLAAGGHAVAGPGNYVEPALFLDVENRMRIAQEEIFGPVLVAMPFDDEAEAIRLANDVRYGLAAYLWTGDLARGHRVAAQLQSGMVWVNSQNVRDLRTPFGGAKDSGIGREGGEYSYHFYCETRTIHVALGEGRIPRFGA